MKIVLTGYMGCGKSTVGRLLARQLNYSFYDLDEVIEQAEGISVDEIFSAKGEIYFRKLESQLLKQYIKNNTKFVLSTGGGTICYGDSLPYLLSSETILIYLKCSVEELSIRLFQEKNLRPLISHLDNHIDLLDFIRKHLFERNQYYNQANIIVGADDSEVLVVNNILNRLF